MHDVRLDAETVTTLRQHGNPSGPRLVISHGSGLAVDLYYPFWLLLADDFDLMVYDLRNHGWNSVGAQRDHNIPTLIHDHDVVLESIDRVYGSKPTVGIFHSLATVVTLLSFSRIYSALVLFDPPLTKPGASQIELHEAAERAAAMIRNRRRWKGYLDNDIRRRVSSAEEPAKQIGSPASRVSATASVKPVRSLDGWPALVA